MHGPVLKIFSYTASGIFRRVEPSAGKKESATPFSTQEVQRQSAALHD